MTDRKGYRATGPTAHPRSGDESFSSTGVPEETVTLDVSPLLPLDSVTLKEVGLEEGLGAGQYSIAGKVLTLHGAHAASDLGLRVVYRIKESAFLPAGAGTQDVRIVDPIGPDVRAASVPVVLATDHGAVPVSGPLTNAELRASPVTIDGNVGVLGAVEIVNDLGNPIPVSGTVGVSGEVEVKNDAGSPIPVSGPLTNTELRATPVPVSGPLNDAQLRATPVPTNDPGLPDTLGQQAAAGSTSVVLASDQVGLLALEATQLKGVPLHKDKVFNTAVLANADILGAALAPTNPTATFRLYVAVAGAGAVLSVRRTEAGVTISETLNGGAALANNAAHMFDILVATGQTINFRVSVGVNVLSFIVVELGGRA